MKPALFLVGVGVGLSVLAPACSDPNSGPYVVVTVTAPPAVHDVDSLTVKVAADGVTITNDIDFESQDFPATFAVDPNGHTGELVVDIEAHDRDGLVVGKGSGTPQGVDDTATIPLDTTDFVVNTNIAGNQYLSFYSAEHGFQVAATPTGDFTTVYREECATPCNVQARRFASTGAPLDSQIAAGPMSFAASELLTTSYATPSVAVSADTSLVVWNAETTDVTPSAYAIKCRAFDADGGAKSAEVKVSDDPSPLLLSVTKLSNQNFAIAWDSGITARNIHGAIVRADCSMVTPPTQISTVASPGDSSIASSADRILYLWTITDTVRGRVMSNANSPLTTDVQIVASTATESITAARVAGLGDGSFAVVTRWKQKTGTTGPGHLDYLHVSSTGVPMGSSVRVSTRSGTDFESTQSFGLAARDDGAVLVVWHSCNELGDGSQCGVFGQLVGADGQLSGATFLVPTTTSGDQIGPSAAALPDGGFAVAWTDSSGTAPDASGNAVRARVVYPATQPPFARQ